MGERPMGGGLHLDVNLHVTVAEMATWRPELVSAFFDGIAQAAEAVGYARAEAFEATRRSLPGSAPTSPQPAGHVWETTEPPGEVGSDG